MATVVLLPQAIDGLVARLDAACGSGAGVDMSDALAAMTMDVIMRTAFGWVPVAGLFAGGWEAHRAWGSCWLQGAGGATGAATGLRAANYAAVPPSRMTSVSTPPCLPHLHATHPTPALPARPSTPPHR